MASLDYSRSAWTCLLYCGFCGALHLSFFLGFSNRLSKLSAKDRTSFYNRGVSTAHALIMFANAIYYWVFLNPSVVISQPMDEYQAGCLLWMMGYLLYDTVFEAVSGTQILTLGHHVLGIASHLSSLLSYNGAAGFYSMLIFIAEGSTPALNASWLLQKLGMTKTLLFKAFAAYLMAAFVVVRLALSAYMVVHMVLHEAEWGADTQVLFWFNTVIVFLFGVLNYFWFYKLLVMALK